MVFFFFDCRGSDLSGPLAQGRGQSPLGEISFVEVRACAGRGALCLVVPLFPCPEVPYPTTPSPVGILCRQQQSEPKGVRTAVSWGEGTSLFEVTIDEILTPPPVIRLGRQPNKGTWVEGGQGQELILE